MKKVLSIISIVLLSLIYASCTNDEGSEDIDVLNPDDEQEIVKDSIN